MKKNRILNSNGLTLIELLASITILSIVIISFLSFFSQSLMLSLKVENRLSAANIAEKILYKVENDQSLIQLLKAGTSDYSKVDSCTNSTLNTKVPGNELDLIPDIANNNDAYTQINNKKYYPDVTICHTQDESKVDLYRVYVQIFVYDKSRSAPTLVYDVYQYINLRNSSS